jgi:hypothetical protein
MTHTFATAYMLALIVSLMLWAPIIALAWWAL